MKNAVVVVAFAVFLIGVIIASLQTSSNTQTAVEKAKKLMQQIPLPSSKITPIVSPIPTVLPINRPGFRVRVGEEDEIEGE